jgi:hypothetical protein
MTHRAAVLAIVAATWTLSACGVVAPEATGARASQAAPQLLVELKTLPHGHPPVPGYALPSALPEGHPPVPGLHPAPALPEGHPQCPASGSLETPPADAGMLPMLHSPPDIIST